MRGYAKTPTDREGVSRERISGWLGRLNPGTRRQGVHWVKKQRTYIATVGKNRAKKDKTEEGSNSEQASET